MNEKSTKSTDSLTWEAELERLGTELLRDFPRLLSAAAPGEPESGLFLPVEIARLPPNVRGFLNGLGLALWRLLQEVKGDLQGHAESCGAPSLEETLAAVREEIKYSARALYTASEVERQAGATPEGNDMLALALRSVRRMNRLVRLLEDSSRTRAMAEELTGDRAS